MEDAAPSKYETTMVPKSKLRNSLLPLQVNETQKLGQLIYTIAFTVKANPMVNKKSCELVVRVGFRTILNISTEMLP
jgi:hypothetical protein